MHKWILTWILPILLYRSYFYIIFLMGTISLACNDMTPEQMATNVNCSSPERHTRSYDYMEGGDVRVRRLFCRTQWYMRIDKRGKVKGTREANNNYSILEIRTVAVGIVAIKGVESEYFLAMNKSGRLYGKLTMSLNSSTILNEENSQGPKRNVACLESLELQTPPSFQDDPLQNLQLASQKVLEKAKKSGRSKCPRCSGSRMFYCYTCFVPVETVPTTEIPTVKLPLKIDIIKHPNETDGKSTAVHAKLLAPDDVTIYKYPCIPEYKERRHEVALIFPGPDSVSVKDIAFHLQKYSRKGVGDSDNGCSKEPFLKKARVEPTEEKDLNECISSNMNESTKLKKVIFIDSTWNQTNKIITDERLQGLLQIELKTRKTCFWRHQKGKPDTYLSTIEAIYYFFVDYHQEILKENYKGQYDNLLFFFSFMYTLIKNAKCGAGKE